MLGQARRFAAALVLVAVLGCAGLAWSPVPAGAADLTCTFNVTPSVLGAGGGTVRVTGNAPGSSLVQIFFNPVGPTPPFIIVPDVPTDPVTGFFQAAFTVTTSGEVTVSVADYPNLACIGVGAGAGGAGAAGAAGRLPRTGASHTQATVLVAMATLTLGLALVVGARRRETVRGR